MSIIVPPHSQLIDYFTWTGDVDKGTSTTIYTSEGKSAYNELPGGTPIYAHVRMTGGGVKLDSAANPSLAFYPLMLSVTEVSPLGTGNDFVRHYPFPGVPKFAYADCIIPLRSNLKTPGKSSYFTFEARASSTGTDAHSAANGNAPEIHVEIYTGHAIERELYTIHHARASLTLAQNLAISSFAFRRANLGSFSIANSNGSATYRLRTFGHRAYDTSNVSEWPNQITSNTVTSGTTVGVPTSNVWMTPSHMDYYVTGASSLSSSNTHLIATIIGGPQ